MSQIYKAGVASTPSVPTSVTTDLQDTLTAALSVATGAVVPQANVLRLGGDNGIKTYEVTLEPGSLTIGFIRGTGTTTDGVTVVPIITQATNANSTMTIQIIAAGFASDTSSAGIYGTAVVKNVAGVVSVVNTVDLIKNTDVALAGVNLTVTGSGSDLVVNVVGVAGLTITWDIALPGFIST